MSTSRYHMNAVEHSRLLYLLDALCAAPAKADRLIAMAIKSGASEAYERVLTQLRDVSDDPPVLISLSRKIKREMK